jgi:metallophosphoesterase (TIGR00282 family)
LRILFVGDVVGGAGRTVVSEHLPRMIRDFALDLVIVNGENSAGGFGITEAIYQELLDAGADAVTLGNHAWDQREALVFIERAPKLVRPANFPPGAPGRGSALIDTRNGKRALVVNAVGRVFMTPFDDPFAVINRELEACPLKVAADAIVVDFHCEASSEKQGIGFHCDGRASLVVGTHTHVPTADHQILPGGTAYMTDAGMTGDYLSIIGMQKEEPLRRFTTGIPSARFEPAFGDATLSGVAVETDDATGLALKVAPVRIGGRLEPTLPSFWTRCNKTTDRPDELSPRPRSNRGRRRARREYAASRREPRKAVAG